MTQNIIQVNYYMISKESIDEQQDLLMAGHRRVIGAADQSVIEAREGQSVFRTDTPPLGQRRSLTEVAVLVAQGELATPSNFRKAENTTVGIELTLVEKPRNHRCAHSGSEHVFCSCMHLFYRSSDSLRASLASRTLPRARSSRWWSSFKNKQL